MKNNKSKKRSLIVAAILAVFSITNLSGALISVDWDSSDTTADGNINGTLNTTIPVTLTSTNGTSNGGVFGGVNFKDDLYTDVLSASGVSTVLNEIMAFDWVTGQVGFVNIDFGSNTVTNPILVFMFLNAATQTFDFGDTLSLSVIDENPTSAISILTGNVVSTDGISADSETQGFSLQLTGAFSSINFATNTTLGVADGVGFSIIADDANINVPEPSVATLFAGIMAVAFLVYKRKNK